MRRSARTLDEVAKVGALRRQKAARSTSALLWLLAMFSATPAMSAGPSELVTRIMGHEPGEGKTFACFRRDYDQAHMDAHPEQSVKSLWVLAVAYSTLDYGVQLRMSFQVRGRSETFTSVGECGRLSGQGRAAVCAGPIGARRTTFSVENERSILLAIDGQPHLWKPGPPDPTHTVNDAFGADDRLFRLDRTELSRCDDQAFDDEKPLLPHEP